MTKYVVTGGTPLIGQVALAGAKNAGFKALVGSLLGDSPSEICDLGLVSEIDFACEAITHLGGTVSQINNNPHCLRVNPSKMRLFTIPKEFGRRSRSSTMYVGPLLARFKKAVVPVPGGDKIGVRPIDRHLEGLTCLGATIKEEDGVFYITAPKGLRGTSYRFQKNTHTGTETLILAAVKAKGVTILENAAAEPEVDDLIKLLNAMGGRIRRTSARTIKIHGVPRLSGAKHAVMRDRIEAATFGCMALATKGSVEILGADATVLQSFLSLVQKAGGKTELINKGVRISYEKKLSATRVQTAPYPGFMTDWQPLWTTLMTQANGESIIHETVYESRFGFISDLVDMGAKIRLFNPKVARPGSVYNFNLYNDQSTNLHAARIIGPSKLVGKPVEINDIRKGATMLLAGMIAKGETIIIDPVDQINRGYENLVERLASLGARIAKIEQ